MNLRPHIILALCICTVICYAKLPSAFQKWAPPATKANVLVLPQTNFTWTSGQYPDGVLPSYEVLVYSTVLNVPLDSWTALIYITNQTNPVVTAPWQPGYYGVRDVWNTLE